jgi:hypothetical protein
MKITFENSPSVKRSTNYGLFKFVKGNRGIRKHVAKIIASMEKHGNLSVGLVAEVIENGKQVFYILDGQHRFEAVKKLGLPFDFKIVKLKSIENVVETISVINNSAKSWGTVDFLDSFVADGRTPYIKFDEILKGYTYEKVTQYKNSSKTTVKTLGIEPLQKLFGISASQFKKGTMDFEGNKEDITLVEQVIEIINFIPNNAQCLRSIAKVMRMEEYNHKVMSEVIKNGSGMWTNDEQILLTELVNEMHMTIAA